MPRHELSVTTVYNHYHIYWELRTFTFTETLKCTTAHFRRTLKMGLLHLNIAVFKNYFQMSDANRILNDIDSQFLRSHLYHTNKRGRGSYTSVLDFFSKMSDNNSTNEASKIMHYSYALKISRFAPFRHIKKKIRGACPRTPLV